MPYSLSYHLMFCVRLFQDYMRMILWFSHSLDKSTCPIIGANCYLCRRYPTFFIWLHHCNPKDASQIFVGHVEYCVLWTIRLCSKP
jgi:hypothetical protein